MRTITFSLLTVGLAVTAACSSGDKPTAASGTTGTTSRATAAKIATTTTTEAPTTTTTEAPTTTTTKPAPQWVTVSKLTGQGSKNGPPFMLQGEQQRVKYYCRMPADSYVGSTSFWIDSERFSCETESGSPSGSGDSMLYLEAGSQHFEINATPNNTWSITIDELR